MQVKVTVSNVKTPEDEFTMYVHCPAGDLDNCETMARALDAAAVLNRRIAALELASREDADHAAP